MTTAPLLCWRLAGSAALLSFVLSQSFPLVRDVLYNCIIYLFIFLLLRGLLKPRVDTPWVGQINIKKLGMRELL